MSFDPTLATIAFGDDRIQQRTLADKVASDLHAGILRGEFPGGSQLKIMELAERYQTSAMPIREALRRLTALGLIEIVPHKGARVIDLSLDDMRDTMSVRLALEPMAVKRAAERSESQDIMAATEALARLEEHLTRAEKADARAAHREFHFALYRGAASPWLVRLIEPVWQNADRYRFAFALSDADQAASNREHRQILAAFVGGNAATAHDLMVGHLTGSMTRVEGLLVDAQQSAPQRKA